MSQQNFEQKTPTMRVNDTQSIPAAVVHAQTRAGKDEAIMGAGLMLRDGGPGTDFAEVSESNPVPVKATLTGQFVEIDNVEYRLHPDGNTLIGLAADKPSPSAAASAIGIGVVYWAADTNTYEKSDGTAWGDLL